MYSLLKGTIRNAKLTITALAEKIGITEKTLRNKLNGETDFTWSEALAIRNIIDPKLSVEQLFKKDDEILASDEKEGAKE